MIRALKLAAAWLWFVLKLLAVFLSVLGVAVGVLATLVAALSAALVTTPLWVPSAMTIFAIQVYDEQVKKYVVEKAASKLT